MNSTPLIQTDFPLKDLNTFGFDQRAEHYAAPSTEDELIESLAYARTRQLAVFVLGAGSNLVLSRDIPGLVIRPTFNAIQFPGSNPDDSAQRVICDAGVIWHDLVRKTVDASLYGLENLSLIPGTAGAAPVQNIGAYGVELAELLEHVDVIDQQTLEQTRLSVPDCAFGYRDSLFKKPAGQTLLITRIHLRLSRLRHIRLSYQALEDAVSHLPGEPDARAISDTVCSIRRQKLPDPATIGNAGSFFKNPTISAGHYQRLKTACPAMPAHQHSDGFRVPAAWLIEQTGWKGHRRGNVGVHDRQALVLVNHGGGSATELLALAKDIRSSVARRFDIKLEQEPVTI